jgi:ribosome maturation factor RimP
MEPDLAVGPVFDRVTAMIRPILDDLGAELYDIEHNGGILRVTVTKQGGLDLDAISLVTRLLSRELDNDDPVPGRYTLEVSSPGLERSLRRSQHFTTAIGEKIAVRLSRPVDGVRRVHGVLVAADAEGITVQLEDAALTECRLAYGDIERAKTVFEWGPAPKPGKGTPHPKARSKAKQPASIEDGSTPTDPDADEAPESTKEAGAS